MFDIDVTELDADGTVAHAAACRATADRAEVQILAAAAHYADQHGVVGRVSPETGRVLPGSERLVEFGGDGTPKVAEFAPAELGAALGLSATSAGLLIGDALDLRHRLPILWGRLVDGEVKAWIGRKIARATRSYDASAAAVVDAKVAPYAGKLSWGRLDTLVSAAIAAADPDRAKADAEAAATRLGVWRQRGTDHGVVTTILRNSAPDAIWFDATIDRVADALALIGDDRDKNTRRAAAVGILANPQDTLDLFQQAATAAAAAADAETAPADAVATSEDSQAAGSAATDGAAGDRLVTDETAAAAADALARIRTEGGVSDPDLPDPDPADPHDDAAEQPEPAAASGRPVDPRPPVTLYLHLTDQTLWSRTGIARFEDIGPVLLDQVTDWLPDSQVTVKPVLDLEGQAPVDGYEIPDRLRDAVHLVNPADTFPYAVNTGRRQDIDHTMPWRPPDRGGPRGQTGIGNLGKLTRRHHRHKTFGAWQARQPFPGIWIWRSPHGRHYLVDHTGTTALGKTTVPAAADNPAA